MICHLHIKIRHQRGVRAKALIQRFDHLVHFFLFALGILVHIHRAVHKVFQHTVCLLHFGGKLHFPIFAVCAVCHKVGDHCGDAPGFGISQHLHGIPRQGGGVQHTGGHGILNIMVQKGNVVRIAHGTAFHRAGPGAFGVGNNPVAHLPAKVQALAVLFQVVHHPQALAVVGKPAGAQPVQCALPRVAVWGVAKIMPQGNGFGQVLIQPQGAGNGSGNLADFQRVGQPGAVVVALRRKKHLCFLLQPPETFTVQNSVPVTLVAGPQVIFRFRGAAAKALLT